METAYKQGYAILVVLGSQRFGSGPPGSGKHDEVLKYLLHRGVPPDVADIVGFTALHHALAQSPVRKHDLARILIKWEVSLGGMFWQRTLHPGRVRGSSTRQA